MTQKRLVASDGYCTVQDEAGRILAQGSYELCRAVVAGEIGTFDRMGDLFDADD